MSNRIPNKHGGGAKTNKNGLLFEQTTSLDSALKNMGFEVRNFKVSYKHSFIGYSVPQVKIYKEFLEAMEDVLPESLYEVVAKVTRNL
ncbi:hypothetical protein PNU99_09210, partial [Streptococcus anginosus]|nr:hypothetical protein [Streptococcus anginosus]